VVLVSGFVILVVVLVFLTDDSEEIKKKKTQKQRQSSSGDGDGELPDGLRRFKPTYFWQHVEEDHVLPAGCEIRMNMATGYNEARLPLSNGAS